MKINDFADVVKTKPIQSQTKQNKPNLLDARMNVSSVKTTNYEQITMNNANKKQSQSNPISVQKARIFANFLPLFTHFLQFSTISRRCVTVTVKLSAILPTPAKSIPLR